jgi:hypothetical protein
MRYGTAIPNTINISTIDAEANAQISSSVQENDVSYLCDRIAYNES